MVGLESKVVLCNLESSRHNVYSENKNHRVNSKTFVQGITACLKKKTAKNINSERVNTLYAVENIQFKEYKGDSI